MVRDQNSQIHLYAVLISHHEATGVAVLDAGAFGKTSYGWVRISFTVDDAVLLEACKRIRGFIDQCQQDNP